MLRNQYGRYVQHHELYPLLGLKPGHALPRAGFYKALRVGLRVTEFICEPATYEPGHGRSSPHRIKFLCDCLRWIPFGRAGQHLRACAAYRRREAI